MWPSQRPDYVEAPLADKTFDNNALRENLQDRGALAVIASKKERKQAIPRDAEMYAWRHLIENYFSRIE